MAPLALSVIRTDGGTQTRATINADTVAEYAEAMRGGAAFPPVTVFYDGSTYWLADGFHRWQAAAKAGRDSIDADIRQGTRRDAVLLSVGANAGHGLRRTNEDKRRAVLTLLTDEEWRGWSDREIARRCGVDKTMVHALRQRGPSGGLHQIERTVARGGTTYQQNTANIRRNREPREAPPPPPPRRAQTLEAPTMPKLRVAHDAADELPSQVCHLINRLAEVTGKVEPERLIAIFPERMLHNLGHLPAVLSFLNRMAAAAEGRTDVVRRSARP